MTLPCHYSPTADREAIQCEDEYDHLADDLCKLRSSAEDIRIALATIRTLSTMNGGPLRLPLRISLMVHDRQIERLKTLCDGWRDSAARARESLEATRRMNRLARV